MRHLSTGSSSRLRQTTLGTVHKLLDKPHTDSSKAQSRSRQICTAAGFPPPAKAQPRFWLGVARTPRAPRRQAPPSQPIKPEGTRPIREHQVLAPLWGHAHRSVYIRGLRGKTRGGAGTEWVRLAPPQSPAGDVVFAARYCIPAPFFRSRCPFSVLHVPIFIILMG